MSLELKQKHCHKCNCRWLLTNCLFSLSLRNHMHFNNCRIRPLLDFITILWKNCNLVRALRSCAQLSCDYCRYCVHWIRYIHSRYRYVKENSRLKLNLIQRSLPFRGDCSLAESSAQAIQRFNLIERHLTRDPKIKEDCGKVIQEYFDLDHAERVPSDVQAVNVRYIPQHCIIRELSSTSKPRVVFDASSKTATRRSFVLVLWLTHRYRKTCLIL